MEKSHSRALRLDLWYRTIGVSIFIIIGSIVSLITGKLANFWLTSLEPALYDRVAPVLYMWCPFSTRGSCSPRVTPFVHVTQLLCCMWSGRRRVADIERRFLCCCYSRYAADDEDDETVLQTMMPRLRASWTQVPLARVVPSGGAGSGSRVNVQCRHVCNTNVANL